MGRPYNTMSHCLLSVVLVSIATVSGKNYFRINKGYKEIPTGIPEDVVRINLHGNPFKEIPSFPCFPLLKHLHLSHTELRDFPNLANVSGSLQNLWMSGNLITQIAPEPLQQFQVLQHLDLSNNRLTSFGDVPGMTSTLTKLNLASNRLTSVPSLRHMGPNLEILNLNFNNIGMVKKKELDWFTQLTSLEMAGTGLTLLPDVSAMASTLQTLNLEDNHISLIPHWYLQQLQVIQIFYVSNNNIAAIPNTCFVANPGTTLAKFDANPLVCDHKLAWWRWQQDHSPPGAFITNGQCLHPALLLHQDINLIAMDQYQRQGQ